MSKPLGTAEYIELMGLHFSTFQKLRRESKNDLEYTIRGSELRMLLTLDTDAQERFVNEHIRTLLMEIQSKL